MDDVHAREVPLVALRHPGKAFERPLSAQEYVLWAPANVLPPGFGVEFYGVHLVGVLDVDALARAIDTITARHDMLRTSYEEVDGVARARVDSLVQPGLQIVDCSTGGKEAALTAVQHAGSLGLDITRAPLSRFLLCILGPTEHWLVQFSHHIACDWRARVLIQRELKHLYRSFSTGETPTLPPVRYQYSDFVAWEQAWLDAEVEREYRSFWDRQLNARPGTGPFAAMRPRPPGQARFRVGEKRVALPVELCRAFATFCTANHTSIASALLALTAALLHRETEEDCLIGVFSCHRRRETFSIIGNFSLIMPIRVQVEGTSSFAEVMARTEAQLAESLRHRDLVPGFTELVGRSPAALLAAARGLPPPPGEPAEPNVPCRVVFNYWGLDGDLPELDGLTATGLQFEQKDQTLFDFEVNCALAPDDALDFHIQYNAELIEADLIDRFVGRLQTMMQISMSDPTRAISSVE